MQIKISTPVLGVTERISENQVEKQLAFFLCSGHSPTVKAEGALAFCSTNKNQKQLQGSKLEIRKAK